ncbi:hypothetical protein ScPMuIL_015535 [Solemya velum]
MTIESFRLFSLKALRSYLSHRKKSVCGTHEELSARAFVAWEEKIPVDQNSELTERRLLEDYKRKLIVEKEIIPDPFSLDSGWISEGQGITKWPSVYFMDIANYLQSKTPAELIHRLMNEYKEGKAYRYFSCEWVKEVKYNSIRHGSPFCILKASVCPSQSVNARPYQVWVVMVKDQASVPGGEIKTAYCSCTAGMLGCCNHIAGVLFRMEAAVMAGITDPACTSRVSIWNVPSTSRGVKPVTAAQATWKKDHYRKISVKSREEEEKARREKHNFNPLSLIQQRKTDQEIRADLLSLVGDEAKNSCFVQLMTNTRVKGSRETLPPSIIRIAENYVRSEDDLEGKKERLIKEIKERIDDENRQILYRSTVDQNLCPDWKEQRHGRVTSSTFYSVHTRVQTLRRDPSQDATALVATVMGYKKNPITAAMKHGLSLEPHAKTAYQVFMRKKHKAFKTAECGLLTHKDHPYISTSPDLETSDSCCGLGLCEIKCPESVKSVNPTVENIPYLKETDTGLELKRKHLYFAQIQGQMGITGRNFCDLFVFTMHGHVLIRIPFESDYWDALLEDIVWFWKEYVCPELLTGEISLKLGKLCIPPVNVLQTLISPRPVGSPGLIRTPRPSGTPGPISKPRPSGTPDPISKPRLSGTPGPIDKPRLSGTPGPIGTPRPSGTPGPIATPRPISTPIRVLITPVRAATPVARTSTGSIVMPKVQMVSLLAKPYACSKGSEPVVVTPSASEQMVSLLPKSISVKSKRKKATNKNSSNKRQASTVRVPIYICGSCGETCTEEPEQTSENSVCCDQCNVWFHFGCVKFDENNVPNDNESWTCPKCL